MAKKEEGEPEEEEKAEERPKISKKAQLRSIHLLERLKYRELLKICRKEELPRKGKKVEIIRRLSKELTPKQVREYYGDMRGTEVVISSHRLVPLHEVMPEEDVEKLIGKLNCKKGDLPKIFDTDPMVLKLAAKPGDVIRITRESETAGEAYYYRLVVPNV